MPTNEEHKAMESQSLTIWGVLWFILIESMKAVVAYIALYFFKPIWYVLVGWWKKRKTKQPEGEPEGDTSESEQ